MLPTLQAQQAMLQTDIVGIGTGSLAQGDAQRILWKWQEAARLTSGPTPEPSPETLQAMGVTRRRRR